MKERTSGVTARVAASRTTPAFRRLLPGVLWRSITRRLAALTGGVVTVALVVGLGTTLACFATVYDRAKLADARFLVGSDMEAAVTGALTNSVARHAASAG